LETVIPMNLDLEGRRVLVTGGSKGIGLACAKGFLAEGAHVAITSRSDANLSTAGAIITMDGASSPIVV
jgi:NAD(P)-dependent dehydrogenase (short-subunit alcohol dehydrogenase family)